MTLKKPRNWYETRLTDSPRDTKPAEFWSSNSGGGSRESTE